MPCRTVGISRDALRTRKGQIAPSGAPGWSIIPPLPPAAKSPAHLPLAAHGRPFTCRSFSRTRARGLRRGRCQPRPSLRAALRRSATRLSEAAASTSGATGRDCSGTPSPDGPAFCRRNHAENSRRSLLRARAASGTSWTGSAPIVAWDVSAATPGGGEYHQPGRLALPDT